MSVMTKPRELDDAFSLVPLTLLRAGQSGRIGEVWGRAGWSSSSARWAYAPG